jgi:hypothetical protein
MSKRSTRKPTFMTILAALVALFLLAAPALAGPGGPGNGKGQEKSQEAKDKNKDDDRASESKDNDGDADNDESTEYTEDTDNDGVDNDDDPTPSSHPSGKDRYEENGKSGNQGKAESHPDDSKGPQRFEGERGADKPNGPGGEDIYDQDGNNGCGNDQDFDDDNNGHCGGKVKSDSPPVPGDQGGNLACPSGTTTFKIDGNPVGGRYSDGTLTVTVTGNNGTSFSWTSNQVVNSVVVKGGPTARLNGGGTSGIAVAPYNPNSGGLYGISHVSFCYVPTTVGGNPPLECEEDCSPPGCKKNCDPPEGGGNISCPSGTTTYKIDSNPANGTYTSGPLTVTISGNTGTSFSWSSNIPVQSVIVKGGPASRINLGGTSGIAASALNPNSGKLYEISHVSFCYTPVTVSPSPTPTPSVLPTVIPSPTPTCTPGTPGCPSGDKITICHATGSSTNPFVTITIDVEGLNGHGDHEGDIIPMPPGGCPIGPDVLPTPPITNPTPPDEVLPTPPITNPTPPLDKDDSEPDDEVLDSIDTNIPPGPEVLPNLEVAGPGPGVLPFTGGAVLPFLLSGLGLLMSGLLLIRRGRGDE